MGRWFRENYCVRQTAVRREGRCRTENQEVIGITVARLALDAKGREAARIISIRLKTRGVR